MIKKWAISYSVSRAPSIFPNEYHKTLTFRKNYHRVDSRNSNSQVQVWVLKPLWFLCSIFIWQPLMYVYTKWMSESWSSERDLGRSIYLPAACSSFFNLLTSHSKDQRLRESLKFGGTEDETLHDKTVSIVHGSNMVDVVYVNFVSSSAAQAREWAAALMSLTHCLLAVNASPMIFLQKQ